MTPGYSVEAEAAIVRDWYEILDAGLGPGGKCAECGAAIAGRFGHRVERFGRRRIRLEVG